ncbi:MAG: hypothetical protein KBH94_06165 [Caldisericia bacterium]|nr:hypothetical protein [Caldisericia bacterium]
MSKYFEEIYKQVLQELPNELIGFLASNYGIEKGFFDRNGEFYSISDFLYEELKAIGADVADCFGLKIWGRKKGSCYVLSDDLLNEIANDTPPNSFDDNNNSKYSLYKIIRGHFLYQKNHLKQKGGQELSS